ncbi:MAG TPA: peptidylprolyl isomerase [Clostridiales bacterium]|nr:peptidylprolyl isomerase [Clostridiales bacterium]HQP70846.1 peptidylprolyl isomerase [Clostridiales bacterium]
MIKAVPFILFIFYFMTSAQCGKCVSLKYTVSSAVFETDSGTIRFTFFDDAAPGHVKNFKDLVSSGFYNGKIFHRVIPDFVIQAGRDSTVEEATIPPEIHKIHFKGALAAARMGDDVNPEKRSDKFEFYVCMKELPHLDGKYTVFGRTAEGFDTAKKISLAPRDSTDDPFKEIKINKAYLEKYFDSEKFEFYRNKNEVR